MPGTVLRIGATALIVAALPVVAAVVPTKPPAYRITMTVALGAPDRWDYVVFDATSHRVYVAHGDRVTVVDGRGGTILGSIEGMPGGTHGIAIAGTSGRGYTDDGHAGVAVAFDVRTLKAVAQIKAEEDADGIVFDPPSGHVFVVDGDSGKLTVIDPKTDTAIATIDAGGGLEAAVSGQNGKLFVDGAEKNEMIRVNTATNLVDAHWPMPGCTSPHGIAIDRRTHRLFASCVNQVLTVLNADNGAIVATLPIGQRTDGAAFDPGRKLVFSSNSEGTLSVIQAQDADRYLSLGDIHTAVTGRTMDIDPETGRLYVAAADVDPKAPPGPNGRPKLVPGSLKLLFLDPPAGASRADRSE
jgi:YVTN family beta-propeller protein